MCTSNGPLIFGPRFKFIFPQRKILLGVWVVWPVVDGSTSAPPPPPVDQHIPGQHAIEGVVHLRVLATALSRSLPVPLRCFRKGLEGVDEKTLQDVYAKCELFSHGQPLCAPAVTPHCTFHSQRWTAWLYFPIMYKDLPMDTLVGVTVYSPALPPPHLLGGTTFFLFTSKGQLKRGMRKYILHEGKVLLHPQSFA